MHEHEIIMLDLILARACVQSSYTSSIINLLTRVTVSEPQSACGPVKHYSIRSYYYQDSDQAARINSVTCKYSLYIYSTHVFRVLSNKRAIHG